MITPTLIAVIDPDPGLSKIVDRALTMDGFQTLLLQEMQGALDVILERKPAVVVMDTWLAAQEDGWTLYNALRAKPETAAVPVVICSSDPEQMLTRAEIFRADRRVSILQKPFDPEDLVARIRQMLVR